MICMWLSPVARNLLVTQANRAQISSATTMLPPWPMQYTCFACRSSATAWSTASGDRAFWVPLMAVIKRADACSQRVVVSASGLGAC